MPEIDVFGEGKTRETAVDTLLDAVREYVLLYLQDVPLYSKVGRRRA